MSLGIVIKAPEGLVLAAESRLTIGADPPHGRSIHVSFDNASKVFSFGWGDNVYIGAVTYGLAAIGGRSPASWMSEFEETLVTERVAAGDPVSIVTDRARVADLAGRLSRFFRAQWEALMPKEYAGPGVTFVVAGFDEGEPYGRVFLIDIPNAPVPVEQNPNPGEFGITWGGQREIVDRLLQGFDNRALEIARRALELPPEKVQALRRAFAELHMQVPLVAMPLQDCVDLAIFFVRTTIEAQRLTLGVRGCGGPIDVATITRDEGLQWVQRKSIRGETTTVEQPTR